MRAEQNPTKSGTENAAQIYVIINILLFINLSQVVNIILHLIINKYQDFNCCVRLILFSVIVWSFSIPTFVGKYFTK